MATEKNETVYIIKPWKLAHSMCRSLYAYFIYSRVRCGVKYKRLSYSTKIESYPLLHFLLLTLRQRNTVSHKCCSVLWRLAWCSASTNAAEATTVME